VSDQLTAHLSGVRQRSERPLGAALPISDDGVRCLMESAADVPLLLNAVEAVLARHQRQERPVRSYDLDLRCPAHEWTKSAARSFSEVRECPDCTYRERFHCVNPDCREHEWPCPERMAITRELLGEVPAAHGECICVRFSDTGGFRVGDPCCPVHGASGTEPLDGPWEVPADGS
jgi:hypothetical protein